MFRIAGTPNYPNRIVRVPSVMREFSASAPHIVAIPHGAADMADGYTLASCRLTFTRFQSACGTPPENWSCEERRLWVDAVIARWSALPESEMMGVTRAPSYGDSNRRPA